MVKHRDSVPADVSTYSVYAPAETAAPAESVCAQAACQIDADTAASWMTE
jgi:hypothetical protein